MNQQYQSNEIMHQPLPHITNNLRFSSLEQSEAFKTKYGCELYLIERKLVSDKDSVSYAECWLCRKANSVVVGFDENDEIVIKENLGIKLIEAIQR